MWSFLICSYDGQDACYSAASQPLWYFDSGASCHITSHWDLFVSLVDAPTSKKVTCANNASYIVKGMGDVVFTCVDGADLKIGDVLYVLGIKKNILSVSMFALLGFDVSLIDALCSVQSMVALSC